MQTAAFTNTHCPSVCLCRLLHSLTPCVCVSLLIAAFIDPQYVSLQAAAPTDPTMFVPADYCVVFTEPPCVCLCRLLRSLPPGLPLLRDALHVLGCGRLLGMWRGRRRLLRRLGRLLLLRGGGRGGGLHRGGVSGRVGLWDTGGLLRLLRLPGDLPGVLLHLLPHVGAANHSRACA